MVTFCMSPMITSAAPSASNPPAPSPTIASPSGADALDERPLRFIPPCAAPSRAPLPRRHAAAAPPRAQIAHCVGSPGAKAAVVARLTRRRTGTAKALRDRMAARGGSTCGIQVLLSLRGRLDLDEDFDLRTREKKRAARFEAGRNCQLSSATFEIESNQISLLQPIVIMGLSTAQPVQECALLRLDESLAQNCLSLLPARNLLRVAATSKAFNKLAKAETVWHSLVARRGLPCVAHPNFETPSVDVRWCELYRRLARINPVNWTHALVRSFAEIHQMLLSIEEDPVIAMALEEGFEVARATPHFHRAVPNLF